MATYPLQDMTRSPTSARRGLEGNVKTLRSGRGSIQNSIGGGAPSLNLASEEVNYTEDFDDASAINQGTVVGQSVRRQSKMDITQRPTAELLRESPAYHLITVEPESTSIESPFMGNKKNLVKYKLSEELI